MLPKNIVNEMDTKEQKERIEGNQQEK